MLYGDNGNSVPQKLYVFLFQTLIFAAAVWLLILNGFSELNHWFGWNLQKGDEGRRTILMAFIFVTYLRMQFTIFYLLKRKIPWEEAITLPFAFGLYYIGFSFLGGITEKPVNGWDILFILLFAAGAFINTFSEVLRDRWKKDVQNKGKLYTEGLFAYSMHVNYFGDLLWVLAFALVSWNMWAMIIPAFLFCFFAFYNIPMLDKYLADKYGEDFQEYQKKTKKFIPFVY
ncbi:DUF1295 domain-containing protein [Falsibacillus albus]|uniref:DUF1295 domain-containing protein n=1 Tax=Falsibacillus albus TaxID=2478915 RepID=A0A3L7K097_9BACI|nr:DUF1295 domain-containing protein [Falsibacillus albus]RLQ94072.1 DUF1295 domain-containing protein [Falsibacillus albus]